jgi:hypothetical protein
MGMKVYKFRHKGKHIRVVAENIINAKKVVERKYKGARFVTIEKILYKNS